MEWTESGSAQRQGLRSQYCTTKVSNHCVSDKSSATEGAPVMKAVATPADSSAREAADGFVADEDAVTTREVGRRGLFRILRPPEPEWEAALASSDEVLHGCGVRAIVREMLWGVALPAEERPRRIGGICVG